MEELINKLNELLNRLNHLKDFDINGLFDITSKLKLYLGKFIPDSEYFEDLEDIEANPTNDYAYNQSSAKLKTLITTILEDVELSKNDYKLNAETHDFIEQAKKDTEILKNQIEASAKEIKKLQEDLQKEKQRVLAEEEKYNLFKTKLEISDKELDFQQQAKNNKNQATIWVLLSALVFVGFLTLLINSLNIYDSFSKIANEVTKNMESKNEQLTITTIYFSYSKFIFSKVLLYSLIIYSFIFCVKNYNAQMHNQIINTHKSNALKSTLSLLNTARSDDGNDKLLIQASQAIFSHQQTGYSGKESEIPNPNIITNVIDAVSKKA